MVFIAVRVESENPDDTREGYYGEYKQFSSIAACLWLTRQTATDSIDSYIFVDVTCVIAGADEAIQ